MTQGGEELLSLQWDLAILMQLGLTATLYMDQHIHHRKRGEARDPGLAYPSPHSSPAENHLPEPAWLTQPDQIPKAIATLLSKGQALRRTPPNWSPPKYLS